jgi:hypothetical protein
MTQLVTEFPLVAWWEEETKIPIRGVLKLHPQKIRISTIKRWCKKGLLIKQERIRLESWKEGRERFTTVEAYRRFVNRQNS